MFNSGESISICDETNLPAFSKEKVDRTEHCQAKCGCDKNPFPSSENFLPHLLLKTYDPLSKHLSVKPNLR